MRRRKFLKSMGATTATIAGASSVPASSFFNLGMFPKSSRSNGYQISSAALFDGSSGYFQFTPSSSANSLKGTFSCWVRRTALGVEQRIFAAGDSGGIYSFIDFSSGDKLRFANENSGAVYSYYETDAVFRDVTGWMHVFVSYDSSQSQLADRLKIYVNGEIHSYSLSIGVEFPLNALVHFGNTSVHRIGAVSYSVSGFYNEYLAELHFVDDSVLSPSSFGEVDTATGQWTPVKYAGTHGANGFYLDFSDNSGGSSLGLDKSGNNNHWAVNGTVTQVTDAPTGGSFCNLNRNLRSGDGYSKYISNGGLTYYDTTSALVDTFVGSLAMTSGKWYWEVTIDSATNASNLSTRIGIALTSDVTAQAPDGSTSTYPGLTPGSWVFNAWGDYANAGKKGTNSTNLTYYDSTISVGTVVGVVYDADLGAIWISVNDSWVDGDGSDVSSVVKSEIESGTVSSSMFSGLSGEMVPVFTVDGVNMQATVNFGQSTFSGNIPAGFSGLSLSMFSSPSIKKPSEHFGALLYSGNGASQSLTGLGFQPDLVWIKSRTSTHWNEIFDSIRGATSTLSTNDTGAEQGWNGLISFDSDGFSVNKNAQTDGTNASGNNYVAWCWKAGGSSVTNNDGSIASQVSVNQTAGFSIVSYQGSASNAVETVGHGLAKAPEFILVKSRTEALAWAGYHISLGASKNIYLNMQLAQQDEITNHPWGDTEPTSQVFSVITNEALYNDWTNDSGQDYISYCWHSVEGYSKFGSYTGNGSTDGPFVYLGFRPGWVMIKKVDTAGGWYIYDNKRDTYNPCGKVLQADGSGIETTPGVSYYLDFLSNGFKLRMSTDVNASGTFIYAAFAEVPLKYARAR
jgi:hypothetical protein